MTYDYQGRTPKQQAENESFGGKGCLAIIVAVCLGLALWAIALLPVWFI